MDVGKAEENEAVDEPDEEEVVDELDTADDDAARDEEL